MRQHRFAAQGFRRGLRRTVRRGFTLVEVAIATAIVGLSIAALMLLITSCTMVGAESTRVSSALAYATNISERCEKLTRAQLLAMDGASYSPAVDATAQPIAEGTGWVQEVSAAYVAPTNAAGPTVTGPTNLVRVNIRVTLHGKEQMTLVRLFAFTEG